MLTLAALDPTAAASSAHPCASAEPDLDQALVAACRDPRQRPRLYGSLLASEVYVTDCELVLGDHGPYVELSPTCIGGARVLAVYTSRSRIEGREQVLDAERVPFTEVLHQLAPEVAVVLDPEGPHAHRIAPAELGLLRHVLAGD